MKTKDTLKSKVILADVRNTSKAVDTIAWRGNRFLKFTLQLRLNNMSVKIYASNVQSPAEDDWTDMTDYFVSKATITSDSFLMSTEDTCVLWWKMSWTRSSYTNYLKAHLYQYGENHD